MLTEQLAPYYALAWQEAEAAFASDEVPVGAVVCQLPTTENNSVSLLGQARNRIIERCDPSAHAELLAIQAACRKIGSERLDETILITTLEPCLMCAGALVLARITEVHYFTQVLSGLGLKDILNLPTTREKPLNHRPRLIEVTAYQQRSEQLLRNFFQKKRKHEST